MGFMVHFRTGATIMLELLAAFALGLGLVAIAIGTLILLLAFVSWLDEQLERWLLGGNE